tara:strand:- start:71 stop:487 length:417 start_codon:yes stop_codon:yes gene_type:complete
MKFSRFDYSYMKMAIEWSLLSHANNKKVGSLIVKDKMIISDGFNGMPSEMDNTCEDLNGITKWEVLHAEANAILKCARRGISCDEATLYITLSPCRHCAKLIFQAGISRVVYNEAYKDPAGLEFLKSRKSIIVQQINL